MWFLNKIFGVCIYAYTNNYYSNITLKLITKSQEKMYKNYLNEHTWSRYRKACRLYMLNISNLIVSEDHTVIWAVSNKLEWKIHGTNHKDLSHFSMTVETRMKNRFPKSRFHFRAYSVTFHCPIFWEISAACNGRQKIQCDRMSDSCSNLSVFHTVCFSLLCLRDLWWRKKKKKSSSPRS